LICLKIHHLRLLKLRRVQQSRINREATELLAQDDFTEPFAEAWAPDEFYFGTGLEMKGWPLGEKVSRHDMTWTEWRHGGPHPHTHASVTPTLAAELAASGRCFERKFATGSGIGKYGRHRQHPATAFHPHPKPTPMAPPAH